jgi:DNA-binding NarL/FixJ family response regulator
MKGNMGERGHILIADDEENFLHTTAALLQREGYRCSCAVDAATSTAMMQAEHYDLLITDIKMPGNSDLELVDYLARSSYKVPVILVTAYPSVESAVRSLQLSVVAYLIKPFDLHELLTAIRRALEDAHPVRTDWPVPAPLVTRDSSRLSLRDREPAAFQQNLSTATIEPLLASLVQNLSRCLADVKRLTERFTAPPREALNQLLSYSDHFLPESRVGDESSFEEQTLAQLFQVPVKSEPFYLQGSSEPRGVLPPEIVEALNSLSMREKEILRRLCMNQRVPTIARALYISPHTVRNHLKSVFRKVGVSSQIELLELLGQGTVRR